MITNTVEKWRTEKGVTKAHMARRIGVKRSYMTKLEQGRLQPSAEMMFKIAKYLGQSLENVFQSVQSAASAAIFCPKRCLTGKFPIRAGCGSEQPTTPENESNNKCS